MHTTSWLTVEGVYKNGKVELAEHPAGVRDDARVVVMFIPSNHAGDSRPAKDRETLRQEAFAQMDEGIPLGGPPYPKRDELYDRFEP